MLEQARAYKTAIIGIGNVLMGDEGIGVRAIQSLDQMPLPADVTLFDGGTAFHALVGELDVFDKLIIVDAVNGGASPGTIYRLELDEILKSREQLVDAPDNGVGPISVHDLGVIETLMTERLYAQVRLAPRSHQPNQVVIIGMEPEQVALSMELSPTIKARIPRLIETVLDELVQSACAAHDSEQQSDEEELS